LYLTVTKLVSIIISGGLHLAEYLALSKKRREAPFTRNAAYVNAEAMIIMAIFIKRLSSLCDGELESKEGNPNTKQMPAHSLLCPNSAREGCTSPVRQRIVCRPFPNHLLRLKNRDPT